MQGMLDVIENSQPIREEKVDAAKRAIRSGLEYNTRILDTAIDTMLDDFIEVTDTHLSAY